MRHSVGSCFLLLVERSSSRLVSHQRRTQTREYPLAGWNTESDWHDLVRSSVRQMVIPQQRGLRDLTRKDQIASERNIVREICATYSSRKDRLKAWKAKTRKGQSAFYRRVKELEKEARLSESNKVRAGARSRKEVAVLT